MQPFYAAEQLYDADAMAGLREALIDLRDQSLDQGNMERAVLLSHTIAVLAHVIRELEA